MLALKDLVRLFVLLTICTRLSLVMAQPPAEAPAVAATPPLQSPFAAEQVSRLVHPEVAAELGLDDQQRARIQMLLGQRMEASASPGTAETTQQLIAIDQQIRDTLSADQWKTWTEDSPASSLRFQFREQPWAEVLDWFSRQEGLTLVMNQVPPGTFTYTDTRSYSASEAIDLLNSVLLTRGFTLVRREKMLTLMQLSNTIPTDLIPRVPLDQLASRGRFELVSVLFSLGNRPVDAVINEVQPYLGSFGRAIPLPQSKQLLVIETAGKMETINVLINTVPETPAVPKPPQPEKPPEAIFAAYALGDLDAVVVLAELKALVGSERIAVDEKTRLLTAFVIPAQQTAIQTAIEKMREKIEAAPASVSVAYPLRSGSEVQIREQVTAIAPRATVSVDAVAARVLITASPEEQTRIAAAFTAMGISAIDVKMEVKAFQVDAIQAAVISAALQSMIPAAQVVGNSSLGTVVVRGSADDIALAEQVIERWRGVDLTADSSLHAFTLPRPGTAQWLATVTKIVPRAKIWLDTDAKQLILLGTAQEKERLDAMLPQLLTALPAPPQRVLKTYELSAPELTRWKAFQPALALQLPDVQPITRPAGEDGSVELLVWATADNQTRLADVIAQLKQATPETALQWPKIYDLDKRDPKMFSELLAIRFPGVRVTSDPTSGQLTVWAEQDTHPKIAELLTQISDELPANPDLVLRSYRSDNRTPVELQTLLAPVIASVIASGGRGTFTPIGTTTVDTVGRRLMIMATEAAHQKIDEFVEELDKPMPVDQEAILLAYNLAEAQATDVKTLIDKAIEGVTVIADDRRQQLIITATLAQHGRIKTIISEVDRPASNFASEEIRAYELNELQAAAILPTLQSLWPRMKLSVDVQSNRIVASGNAPDHESFRLSIERLNTSATGEAMRVETYSVPMGDLTTLPAVLNQIAPQAIISTDAINRAIVVWASDEQHKRIAAAIEQLTVTAESRREIEVHQVAPEKAAITRLVLISLFPTANIGADALSGQLTVLAPKDLQQKIAEVLEKTTKADRAGSKLEPRLYDTIAETRTAFTSVLTTTIPSATVIKTGSTNPNQLMILASSEDHERATALLKKLSEETGPLPETSVQAYELNRADPTAFQTFLAERQPAAKILSGAGTSRMVIAATQQAHAVIAETVAELEKVFAEAGQRELHVYPLRKDLTQQAVTGASTEVPRATLLPSTDPERILLLASPTEHTKYAAWLDQLQQQVPEPKPTTSEAYPLKYGDPTGAVRVLQTLLPKVVFAADIVGKTVAATATAEDHETIHAFIQQYDDRQMDDAETKVFSLGDADATSLSLAVTQMAPTARVTPDRIGNRLIVTAPKETLDRITAAIDSMESDPTKQRTTQSYGLDEGTTYSLIPAIQGSFPRAKISADVTNNRLIISATDAEHVEIAKLFDTLNSGENKVTKSYALESGSAATLRLALQATYPQATIGADPVNDTLIVSAPEKEQQEIAVLVQQISDAPARATDMQAYPLAKANPQSVVVALQQAFGRRSTAGVSADEQSGTVFVVGVPRDQEIAKQVIEQMDRVDPLARDRRLKTFSLAGINGENVAEAVQSLFNDARPPVDVRFDFYNEQLVVIGNEQQLKLIEETMAQFDPPKRELAIFPLQQNDPNSAREAVNALFADLPSGEVPAITVDNDRQQLLIRATTEQLGEIRALLARLGETVPAEPTDNQGAAGSPSKSQGAATANVGTRARTIAVGRNSESLLQQVQQAWPNLRQNPLRVIRSNKSKANEHDTSNDGANIDANSRDDSAVSLVATQVIQEPAAAEDSDEPEKPAVLILPGDGQWVIASEDTEALDMLATLLELAVTPPITPVAESGNLSIYVLQHGNADELTKLLTDLFQQTREGSRTRLNTETSQTKIVADTRINALVVQSSRATRGVIEDLLAVLDSPEFNDSLQLATPQLVPVLNTSATRVEEMLRTVYSSQLSRGRNRPQVSIPEGVSQEVASMLEQINAETSGPLLTLSVDDVSNSIVMRAPAELSEEIRSFVKQVDVQAISSRSGSMRIIPLQQSNVKQIEQVLQQFMQGRRAASKR